MAINRSFQYVKYINRWSVRCIYFQHLQKQANYFSTTICKLNDSYFHRSSSIPLTGKSLNSGIKEVVEKFSNKKAITVSYQNITKTFEELYSESETLAASLIDLGLRKGDHLGICAPNCYEWIVTELASIKAGFVLVAINAAYKIPELEYCLKKTQCKALIIPQKFYTQNYYEMVCKITGNLDKSAPGELKSERLPHLTSVILISPERMPGTFTVDEMLKKKSSTGLRIMQENEKEIQMDDPAFILFTSGTTGRSKAVEISSHGVMNNMHHFGTGIEISDLSCICTGVPLFHIFGSLGSVLMPVFFGCHVVLPGPRFDAKAALTSIQKERCTILFGTPTMLYDVINHPDFSKEAISTLQLAFTGAAPVPEKFVKQILQYIPEVLIGYGATETLCTFLTEKSDPLEKKISTVGRPVPHMEVKIVDPNSEIVPFNTDGEIWTRGYGNLLDYYNENENKLKECVTAAKWYKTGDVGSIDEDGYLKVKSRIKDLVIRGGTNIYPAEIEAVLINHPSVFDVQVCGVPDERLGEEVCAWIKIRPEKTLTENEVKEFCKDKMAYFKIPRYILFVNQFPITPSGKVQKFVMKEESVNLLKEQNRSH